MTRAPRQICCTSFCNFAHYVDTGRPIDHECYVIPPAALEAEINGDTDKAIVLMRTMNRNPVKGRPIKVRS